MNKKLSAENKDLKNRLQAVLDISEEQSKMKNTSAQSIVIGSLQPDKCVKAKPEMVSNSTSMDHDIPFFDFLVKENQDLKEKLIEAEKLLHDSKKNKINLIEKLKKLSNDYCLQEKAATNGSLLGITQSVSNSVHNLDESLAEVQIYKLLSSHKWDLQKSILKLQKELLKGSPALLTKHLNFIKHIFSIHIQEIDFTPYKSSSEPVLGSVNRTDVFSSRKDGMKNLLPSLELDVKMLKNIRLLLKYFVLPLVQKSSKENIADKNVLQDKPEKEREKYMELTHILESLEQLRQSTTVSQDLIAPETESELRLQKKILELAEKLKTSESIIEALEEQLEVPKQTFEVEPSEYFQIGTGSQSMLKLIQENKMLQDKIDVLNKANFSLRNKLKKKSKSLEKGPKDAGISDEESVPSLEDTLTLSRSESISSFGMESSIGPYRLLEPCKTSSDKILDYQVQGTAHNLEPERDIPDYYYEKHESIHDPAFLRSHYSSPDLGIESDPNHDNMGSEHLGEHIIYHRRQQFDVSHEEPVKLVSKTVPSNNVTDVINEKGFFRGELRASVLRYDGLRVIGCLTDYELLKKELAESLVEIKGISSRATDYLQHLPKNTTPKKSLEHSTLKAILDSCNYLEVCLCKAQDLVARFCISAVPPAFDNDATNSLLLLNEELQRKLHKMANEMKMREKEYKDSMQLLEHHRKKKEMMERKISEKLLQTKKVMRKVKANLQGNNRDLSTPAK